MKLSMLKNIIESYKIEKLKGIDIIDFLYEINSSEKDKKIFKRWKKWFTDKDVPWIVTQEGSRCKLWKEDERLLTFIELEKERDKPGVNWYCVK